MLMTGHYKGNPMIAHMRLDMVRPEHFERWLAHFRKAAREICPHIAELFIGRAENIARSLQLGMFFKSSDLTKAATGSISHDLGPTQPLSQRSSK